MKMPARSPAAAERLGELTPSGEDVSVRAVFGQPAAFARGHMFMGCFGERVFVRLSEPDQRSALAEPGVSRFEPMPGRPMAGYVVLPERMLRDLPVAREWVARSLAFVRSLPPKAPKSRSKPPGKGTAPRRAR